MRASARIALAVLTASMLLVVTAPAATASLRLRVVGLEPGQRFGGDQVLKGFGCTGGNLSPGLEIGGVPAGAQSLAVTIHDPDAPTQSGWWHWLVYDLPASTRTLAEGAGSVDRAALPSGAQQGPNDFGERAYGGVCPPAGDRPHRYRVTLWALKVRTIEPSLGALAGASAAFIDYLIESNAVARRTVIVRSSR